MSIAEVTPRPRPRDLSERVLAATTHLLLVRGLKWLRTAEIASAAGTTESTLFRHFDGLEHVLELAYGRAWRLVNEQIALAAFENAHVHDPKERLLLDTKALWGMKNDPNLAEAATFAFLFYRRREQLLGQGSEPASEEVRFRRRLESLCEAIADADEGDLDGRLLGAHIMNYAASVWLTWATMPVGSDDISGAHDLTPDEAQLGMLVLHERWRGRDDDGDDDAGDGFRSRDEVRKG